MYLSFRQAVVLSLALGFAASAPTTSAQLSGDVIDERLDFLEEHLAADRKHAAYWQWGWMGVAGGGMITGAVRATDQDGDDRTDDIVNATTAAIDLMYLLLRPMEARLGASKIRSMPARSLAQKQNKLLAAEALLERNALRAKQRTSWKAHAASLAFHATAFAFIAGFGNMSDAAISGGAGAVAGSLQLWSQPKRATTDWREYQALRAKTALPKHRKWRVLPRAGRIAFQYDF